MHKTMYRSWSYETLMKNASLSNGKPTDLNQNKLWMQKVMALPVLTTQ